MKTIKLLAINLLIGASIIFLTDCKKHKKKEEPFPDSNTGIRNWSSISSSITDSLLKDQFTDDLTGYVCGVGGVIYKTTDGFASYTTLNSGTNEDLYGMYFTSATTGYAVGNGSTILKTVDGGQNWTALSSPSSENFRQVFFVDANTGYITGGVGTLLKTTDAGQNWTSLNPGTSVDLHGVFFTDANTGYVSGQYYTLLKTTDGGANWSPINTGLTGGTGVTPLLSIYFTDANTGYVAGGYAYPSGTPSEAVIIKTTDGGVNWTSQANPAGTNLLYNMKFSDSKTGYIVGGDVANNTSMLIKTTDGGSNWSIQTTSTFRLTSVALVSSGEAYAVGLNGAILKGNL